MPKTPYLIAEIGVNHEGNLQTALEMIDSVCEAGWHAAKFQTYSADSLAAKDLSPAYWDTRAEPETSQYKLFSKFRAFTVEDYNQLELRCQSRGIDFLTTAFDRDSMAYFSKRLTRIKIASADLTNRPLVRQAAASGKPLILSCGAAAVSEIRNCVEDAVDAGASDITLLHCVLNYPTQHSNANIEGVRQLMGEFPNLSVGYSDHTKYSPDDRIQPCALAFILGATIIEKHFTHNRDLPGNDHYHSADLEGLVRIREQIDAAHELLGSGLEAALDVQYLARENARRRIFAETDLEAGATITEQDLIPLRGNTGIEVVHWDEVVGSIATAYIGQGNPIEWSLIQK